MAERQSGTKVTRELFERLANEPGTVDVARLFVWHEVRAAAASRGCNE